MVCVNVLAVLISYKGVSKVVSHNKKRKVAPCGNLRVIPQIKYIIKCENCQCNLYLIDIILLCFEHTKAVWTIGFQDLFRIWNLTEIDL